MSVTYLDLEPNEITAGDTVRWKRDLTEAINAINDSDVLTWSVAYYITGPTVRTFSGSALDLNAPKTFYMAVPSTESITWQTGIHRLEGFFSVAGTERRKFYSGALNVLVNPVDSVAGSEVRSHAKICLDAVEEVIEARASRPEQQYQIEGIGRQFVYKTDSELMKLRDYYLAEYQQELAADAIRRGEGVKKNIGVKFGSPW